jgi:2-C-methyl-D-erythritol 4-phosphate cytidylyltransferase
MVTALIFAGGTGTRMKNTDVPKQFLEVGGIPIIIRTLSFFSEHPLVDNVVVVCLEGWIDQLKADIEDYRIKGVIGIIPGGQTGFESIRKGLDRICEISKPDDIVLICDGVRPILSEALITDCIKGAEEFGTAVPVTKSIDSVLYSDDGIMCSKNIKREKIYITQAPQGYRLEIIMNAHNIAREKNIQSISSADLMLDLGMEVHLIPGIRENIKVTTREDLNTIRATEYYEHFKDFSREELKYAE